MRYRVLAAAVLAITMTVSLCAQLSRDARYEILRTVIAEQAASRIPMPFGKDGFELTDTGAIDQKKLAEDIKKNGQSVAPGGVVTITDIAFSDNKIDIELDGGGKNKKAWYDRIQIGVGQTSTPVDRKDESKAKGSKITLKFAKKAPQDLSPADLHKLLNPVLDFDAHTFMKTGLESLPAEFQDAVKAKEPRIGMDRSTVIMALGRPDKRFWEVPSGATQQQESWIYFGRGLRALFIWFENDVVVKFSQF